MEQLLREDMVLSTESVASNAYVLLCLFETVTGETFADTPGVRLTSRISGIGRTMANVVRDIEFDPPLVAYYKSGRASWN